MICDYHETEYDCVKCDKCQMWDESDIKTCSQWWYASHRIDNCTVEKVHFGLWNNLLHLWNSSFCIMEYIIALLCWIYMWSIYTIPCIYLTGISHFVCYNIKLLAYSWVCLRFLWGLLSYSQTSSRLWSLVIIKYLKKEFCDAAWCIAYPWWCIAYPWHSIWITHKPKLQTNKFIKSDNFD